MAQMKPRYLVATDLSDQAGFAIGRAIELAAEAEGEVVIVHIVDETLPENAQSFLTSTSDHMIRSNLSHLPLADRVAVTVDIVTGRPDVDIAERALIEDADCIIVGLHNRLLEENRAIEGTLGEQIIRSTTKPTLLVKNKPKGPYSSVVIGVDFSAYSRAALIAAATLAPKADLHLIHAYQPSLPRPIFRRLSDDETRSKLLAEDRARMEAFINAEMTALSSSGTVEEQDTSRMQCHSREGDPRDVLKKEAERLAADLIVVGTHARIGMQRALLGSVSTDLINDRITDVLVVRPY
ncbi:MAG: universal stress protein [Pseudomonadota bacterium]|jgi:nucleotide-binding universal stress UspA family protein